VLFRFRTVNAFSFRTEAELSLLSPHTAEHARKTGTKARGRELAALPLAVVFGANASGKSNLLAAMHWMARTVTGQIPGWEPGARRIPRPLFALDPEARDEATLFEAEFVLGGARWVYGFELSDTRVESEWLHEWPGTGRRRTWFERDPDRQDPYSYPSDWLKGDRAQLERLTRPDALFLTVAANFNHPQLTPVYQWFHDNLQLIQPGGVMERQFARTIELLGEEPYRTRITHLLRLADLGIEGVELVENAQGGTEPRLTHHGKSAPLPLDFARAESSGTRAWLAVLGPMLFALSHGRVLLIDELDSSLHPFLVAEVLRLFRDPDANPHNAQLVCTVHDASLLGSAHPEPVLGKHEVWITEKTRTGESELYPLTDARPDDKTNLERGYLRGRYGGLPRIGIGRLATLVERDLHEAG
jgi:hypothetical protein